MLEQSIAKPPASPRGNKTSEAPVHRAFISPRPHPPRRTSVGKTL